MTVQVKGSGSCSDEAVGHLQDDLGSGAAGASGDGVPLNPIALAQGWLWLSGLFLLGEAWLPAPFLTGISVFYVATVGLSLGALYASLPFAVAYANRIQPETS